MSLGGALRYGVQSSTGLRTGAARSCSFGGEVLLCRAHGAAIRFMARKAKAKFVPLSEVIAGMGRLCTKRHGLHRICI